MENSCPLCLEKRVLEKFDSDNSREYWLCGNCSLVYVPQKFHLSSGDEKFRYDAHQNSPHDPQYRRFLSQLFLPMQELLAPNSRGLDFGSGPGPTLSVMFIEQGHHVDCYDKFYARDESVLSNQYDFITSTEVFEHLENPRQVMEKLTRCLRPGAYLGIMTNLYPERGEFSNWYYKNDPTHVCFYSTKTFEYMASTFDLEVKFVRENVIIFCKTSLQKRLAD